LTDDVPGAAFSRRVKCNFDEPVKAAAITLVIDQTTRKPECSADAGAATTLQRRESPARWAFHIHVVWRSAP
jgi:hypothetical protein